MYVDPFLCGVYLHTSYCFKHQTMKIWDNENMRQWKYETVKIWDNENMRQWKYETVQIWDSENMRQWKYETMKIWDSANMCETDNVKTIIWSIIVLVSCHLSWLHSHSSPLLVKQRVDDVKSDRCQMGEQLCEKNITCLIEIEIWIQCSTLSTSFLDTVLPSLLEHYFLDIISLSLLGYCFAVASWISFRHRFSDIK